MQGMWSPKKLLNIEADLTRAGFSSSTPMSPPRRPCRRSASGRTARHAVVGLRNEFVRLADDHCAGLDPLAGLAILPLIPEPADRQHRPAVPVRAPARLLPAPRALPFPVTRPPHTPPPRLHLLS